LIEVSGRNMHLNCVGEGSPTVVFEAGFGGWSDTWYRVQPEVGEFTRACAYDRAGLGWSEVSGEPRTQEQIAIELHELLAAANVQPPYVLVGHSMGGKSIRLFTELYPDDVSGLVFVDARHENQEPTDRTPEQNAADGAAYEASFNLHRILRTTGLVRLFGVPLAHMIDPTTNTLPDDMVYRLAMFGVRETVIQTLIAESHESMTNDTQLSAAQLPDGLPVVVLTAYYSLHSPLARESIPNWELGQESLAALSWNSQRLTIDDSSHSIQLDQPQAVIDAIRVMLEAAQTGEPLAD
jgi:pimeloyl-ACP methyl ester carboxylesterase